MNWLVNPSLLKLSILRNSSETPVVYYSSTGSSFFILFGRMHFVLSVIVCFKNFSKLSTTIKSDWINWWISLTERVWISENSTLGKTHFIFWISILSTKAHFINKVIWASGGKVKEFFSWLAHYTVSNLATDLKFGM